jgi:hypothetical protein
MKPVFLRSFFVAIILFMPITATAGAQSSISSGPLPQHQPQHRAGFLDYALSKINPDAKDYGGDLRADRSALLEGSVDDIYFWSNAISIVLLAMVSVLFCLHLRSSEKKEFIAATLLTEFWNRATSDRIELQARTEEFNQLSSRYSAEAQRSLATSEAQEDDKKSSSRLQRTIDHVIEKPSKASAAREESSSGADLTVRQGVAKHDVTTVHLQERVILLQKRIAEMKKVEQNLKEQVNRKDALLDQSERRNRTLKGA